ncbi:MAG: ATP-binding cassette domain-containing protein [Chloroflexi bacterium]|nr:MAG: ATP-binding cassette domain-containing protein [Chloroflexota bacterium]
MIKTVDLTKVFGDFVAAENICVNVLQGEVLAFLGPNGAGKTTTVRMLGSILKPTRGYARIAGYDTVKNSREVRQIIGLLTEFPGLYQRMTGIDYLRFFGELQNMPRQLLRDRSEQLLKRFELWDAHNKPIGTYSKGMKQKLTLVRAMLHDPLVLFLDEPTSAMDPHSAKLVRDSIADLRRDKRTIVLCTHNLAEAEQLADRIAIISRGKIIAQGTPRELKQRLLGNPVMEIRLAEPANGLVNYLAGQATVLEAGKDWVRYSVADPAQFNPALLAELGRRQVSVVTLSEVSRSLEEVYLRIVESDPVGNPNPAGSGQETA